MGDAEEFDEFYVATRRRLVHQTLALTGDLAAARSAVRDAFVAARHHWRKVSRLDDPEDWVRPQAWSIAQRRHVTRIWHREKGIDTGQADVLEALHKLPDVQRKTLLLTHLAALDMPAIGREIGETQLRAEHHLQSATSAMAVALDCDSTSIRARLESLAPLANAAALPRAPIIRRTGLRRRRLHTITGAVVAVAVTIGAGAFVTDHPTGRSGTGQAAHFTHPVTRAMLLPVADVAPIAPKQPWQLVSTDDNTEGTGINTVCQTARFADPQGLATLVRKFAAAGKTPRSLVQTVEVSASPGAARKAYKTTLGWYAGCQQARLQLLSSYAVSKLGEQAQALTLRIPAATPRSYVVAVARTGSLTMSTVLETRNAPAPDVAKVVTALEMSVHRMCLSDAAGFCTGTPVIAPVLPPPSGETPGMLAVADLPAVGKIPYPWVGTAPQRPTINPAATTCDHADFAAAGSPTALNRTFLIPQAKLPDRFGLTETMGQFATPKAAATFVARIDKRLGSCEKDDLGATVSHPFAQAKGYRGSSFSGWRVDNQINKNEDKVGYWMGVARVGAFVAQINFTPSAGNDIDEDAFKALLARSRDRLFEVANKPAAGAS